MPVHQRAAASVCDDCSPVRTSSSSATATSPLVERADDGFLIVNPGSPTDRRRQPVHTMAELLIAPGAPVDAVIIPLDGPGGAGSEND